MYPTSSGSRQRGCTRCAIPARIAAVRLRNEPRPLRLCYAGQVVRVVGDALRSARQFGQIGCELIGTSSAEADAEAVLLADQVLLLFLMLVLYQLQLVEQLLIQQQVSVHLQVR